MSQPIIPNSPVTGNDVVRHFDSISVADIVRLYRQQEGMEVGKYFGDLVDVKILECEDTGYRFYYPLSVAGDESFYRDLGEKADSTGLDYDRDWADDHSIAERQLRPSDILLEIGCNTGKFLERINSHVSEVRGLEFNEIAAEKARSKGLEVANESIEEYSGAHTEEFDVICAFQVLEHVTNVGSFLNSALRALGPNGRLIFSVPNNEPYFQRFNKYEVMNLPPHHVGLWNLKAFQKLGDVFEMDLVDHGYSGLTSFRGDIYIRARSLAKIKSPPRHHTRYEKTLIFAAAPFATVGSAFDRFRGVNNFGHITVTFQKRSI